MLEATQSESFAVRLSRALFWLALPVLGEQLLVLGVGQFDTFLAGRINKTATAAVAVGAYVSWGASLLFSLVGSGATALVARAWGAGNKEEANHLFNQATPLAILTGSLAGALVWVFAPQLAWLQNMEGESRDIMVAYLRIDALGHPLGSLMLVANACWRGAGNMRTPFLLLSVVNILNMIISPVLVFGWLGIPTWGTTGIVGGTVIARVCGGLLAAILLWHGHHGLHFLRSELWPSWISLRRLLNIGAPALVESTVKWSGHFAFLSVVSHLAQGERGEATLAAHYIGIQWEALTYLPAFAYGTAAATLIGQALGAGRTAEARWLAHLAVWQCAGVTMAASLFYYFGAQWAYQVMSRDPLVWEIGVPALKFIAFFQPPLVVAIVYQLALNGAGDTRFTMMFSLLCTLCLRVPVAYVGGIWLDGGLIGAWWGMSLDNTIRGLLAWWRYWRGAWVRIRV